MARAAVDSSWITVSPCEIARRRILDYVTTLDGIRQNGTLVVFLVAADELVRLDLPEICDAGHQCITICRPQEHERLKAQLGSRWRRVAHVVEDLALLSAEYEAATSTKIRKDLLLIGRGDCNRHQTTTTKTLSLLPDAVRHYIFRNRIAQKVRTHTLALINSQFTKTDGRRREVDEE